MLQEAPLVSHRRALGAALAILILSAVFAVASNRLRTRSMALFRPLPALQEGDIDLLGARQLLGRDDVVFLDARSEKAFRVSHIPKAINIPYRRFQGMYPDLEAQLQGKTLITYCSSPRCPKADVLRGYLETKGHQDVRVLRPGLAVWVQERLPTESGP